MSSKLAGAQMSRLLVLVASVSPLLSAVACADDRPGSTAAEPGGGTSNGGSTAWGGALSTGGKATGVSAASGREPLSVGGTIATGGTTNENRTGGSIATGGSTLSGGVTGKGGVSSGGVTGKGGSTLSGGATGKGGVSSGGVTGKGGSSISGGVTGKGGVSSGGADTATGGNSGSGDGTKARIIVTTDGEVDDRSSMVRFLMYASDYDVVGIVQNNSIYQKNGHSKEGWIEKEVDLYAQILPNLKKHHPDFPDPAYLRSVIAVGNENAADLQVAPPDMATKDTPGSAMIIKALLDADPRPVHVPSWGGANTTAYALWKLKTAYTKEQFAYAASRIRIYGICYNLTNKAQDGGFKWIIDNIPEAILYQATSWAGTWSYDSVDGERNPSKNPKDVQAYMNRAWMDANVKTGHGPLGAYYPQAYNSEGDTPSFLNLINNGLDAHLDYRLGGWGGRAQVSKGNYLVDAPDGGSIYAAVYRWTIAAQNDFAARMDWGMAADFKGANHNPKAKVAGGLVRNVAGGESVLLDASGTTDPDGHALTFKWWQYDDADSVSTKVAITGADTPNAIFTAPNEPGRQAQIILEVTDNGTPRLTHYQRIFVNIK